MAVFFVLSDDCVDTDAVSYTHLAVYKRQVLACCLIACLLLGSALFAYYCMFAAIAIELIGAVYYTCLLYPSRCV